MNDLEHAVLRRSRLPAHSTGMKRSHVLGSLAGIAAVVAMLAGCATGAASSSSTKPASTPTEAVPLHAFGPMANWIDSGRAIALAVPASKHCPVRLHDVTANGQQVKVELEVQRTDIGCERNELHGIYVPLPEGVATDRPVELSVTTDGEDPVGLAVPALPKAVADADVQQPAATLLTTDQVAILSWGSSSCVPRVDGPVQVEESNPARLRVAFAADDRPCTLDLAPRITVVAAEGLVAGSPVTLEHLNGSGDPVTTTIQYPAPSAG